MSRIWVNADSSCLLHAEDLDEVRTICASEDLPFEAEHDVSNKLLEELLAEVVDLIGACSEIRDVDPKRYRRMRALAEGLKNAEKTVKVPLWRPLSEVETVFLHDHGGKRKPHRPRKLVRRARGIIARKNGGRLVDVRPEPAPQPEKPA